MSHATLTPSRPREYSRLDRLVRLLREAALAGRPCPTNFELNDALDIQGSQLNQILHDAQRFGHIVIERPAPSVRVIRAYDGSWATQSAPDLRTMISARRRRPGTAGALPKRLCLKCRESFAPRHRHNFLCDPCNHSNGMD